MTNKYIYAYIHSTKLSYILQNYEIIIQYCEENRSFNTWSVSSRFDGGKIYNVYKSSFQEPTFWFSNEKVQSIYTL